MSHGVHAVQHEVEHHIEHEEHGHGGGHGKGLLDNINKKIALVISVMALLLAVSEMLGKSAQTEGISANVEAANLWAFFQAKTIRRTLVETAAREMTINAKATNDAAVRAEMDKQIATWKSEAARYRSELVHAGRLKRARGRAPSKPKRSATSPWRDTTTTNSPPPPSRSASCSLRRRSSPA